MKILYLSFLLFLAGAASQPVCAQAVSLANLLAIGAEPAALTAPEAVTKHLPAEWRYKAPTADSREAFWALPAAEGLALPVARLTVRAQRPGQDVVLKTTDASEVRGIRNELKSKKLTSEPVTCPSCEGLRFKGPDFDATIYSEMKGDYPFVVVVHQGAAGPEASNQLPPVAAVDVATATQLLADPKTLVLDVRTPAEYATGHLQGAQNVDFRAADFRQRLAQLDPKARYVLYCASGNRSGQAAAVMKQLGLPNVVNAGGYPALKAAGQK